MTYPKENSTPNWLSVTLKACDPEPFLVVSMMCFQKLRAIFIMVLKITEEIHEQNTISLPAFLNSLYQCYRLLGQINGN